MARRSLGMASSGQRGRETPGNTKPLTAVAEIERTVYQTSKGGRIYCPLEDSARTMLSATPKFAQQISHKYSQGNARSVCADLRDNHHRTLAKSTVQNIADWVGGIACAQEQNWEYAPPELDEAITTVVLSLEGAYLLMANDGSRGDGRRYLALR